MGPTSSRNANQDWSVADSPDPAQALRASVFWWAIAVSKPELVDIHAAFTPAHLPSDRAENRKCHRA